MGPVAPAEDRSAGDVRPRQVLLEGTLPTLCRRDYPLAALGRWLCLRPYFTLKLRHFVVTAVVVVVLPSVACRR